MKRNAIYILIMAAYLTSSANLYSDVPKKSQSGTTMASDGNQLIWTFDCNSQGWGDFDHSESFNILHQLENEMVSSGHLEFWNKPGNKTGWLFGPYWEDINADNYDYLHFSLSLENAGSLPIEGIQSLFVWDITADGAMNDLRSETFNIYGGQNEYTIDLRGNADWKGMININRFHFPQGDQTVNGYTPESAVFRLDWVALSSDPDFKILVQDTTQACAPKLPVLSNEVESVVFCNRVSVKTSYTGSRVEATFKLWADNTTDTISQTRTIYQEGNLYFSAYDLELNTNYSYDIRVSNFLGYDKSHTGRFVTEGEVAEDQPMNYWMTPSPFRLTENASDHLLDNDTWPEAGGLAQVYKIHGAAYFGGFHGFYIYDIPKLIYTINKNRMRLAYETVVGGDRTGLEYANDIIKTIEEIALLGGKLEFLTWDGMFLHSINSHQTKLNFRTIEEGIEAVAEATKLVKDRYPDFEIIPLPNLPNWDVRDANGNIILHNAGNNAGNMGVTSWMDLADLYISKIQEKGVSINFIQIDHPYHYYVKDSRDQSKQRVTAVKDYCALHNLELIVIINESNVGSGDYASQDALFKKGCIDFLNVLREDGINPQYIDVESWYEFPQYLVPETKENSFTNVIRDVGINFLLGGRIIISAVDNLNEIIGFEETLQLFAIHKETGDTLDAHWRVDKPWIATVNDQGLLISNDWGKVTVTATAKNGPAYFASITIKVIDPNEPTSIVIRSEGDITEIKGVGTTLQFYADNTANGEAASVNWSVNNHRAASIDSNGLLTSIRTLGILDVIAVLKSNPDVRETFQLNITSISTVISNLSGLDQIKVFPIPANQYLHIEIPGNFVNATAKIYEIGSQVKLIKRDLESGNHTINIQELSNGIYLLQIIAGEYQMINKIVINR
jgi:hypothetical protein